MIQSIAPTLLEQALELPYDDRAELVDRLIESLHPPVDEAKDDAYWEKEIARRLQDYDSGAVQGMTWSEARAPISWEKTLNMRQLRIHPLAAREIRDAREGYELRSVPVAERFMEEIDRAIDKITDSPQLFPSHVHGTRFYRLRRYPFLIVYRMTDEEVFVVAVPHHRRRIDYWADRLT